MALVDYPSSSEEEENTNETPKPSNPDINNLKRKRDAPSPSPLPPLPSSFHDLYASNKRVSTKDDPTLHGGRKRVIPHIEGNWPTHIYIEWYPSTTEDASLSNLISALQKEGSINEDEQAKVHSSVTSDVGVPLPLHISLSRSLRFSAAQKDDFVTFLSQSLKSSGIRPFNISFTTLKWVSNFERTRWFLVLSIRKPESDGLNRILHVCNSVVTSYGQPPLYPNSKPAINPANQPPKPKNQENKKSHSGNSKSFIDWAEMQDATDAFHISLAWTLRDPSKELLELTKKAAEERFGEVRGIEVKVENVKCKVGNGVTSIPLKRNAFERG